MTSLVERGFGLLNRAMSPAAATTVRYIRAATEIGAALPATLSAPQIALVTEGGAALIGRQFKWNLKRSELLIDGIADRPRRGDQIEWVNNERTYRFEVLPEIGGSESAAVDPRLDWVPASVKLVSTSDE